MTRIAVEPLALEDFPDFERQALAQADVEVGERFVEQDQFGARRQRAGQRDTLLLAAGKLVRILVALAVQADRGEQLADAQAGLGCRQAAQPEGDVFVDGEVREQRVILEDHADAPLLRRQALAGTADHGAAQADLAAGDLLEAGDAAQQGRLAAARGAEQAGDAPAFNAAVNTVDDGMAAVALDDAAEFKLVHGARL